MPAPDRDWEGVRLHVVTGKGGTGKTTVAAALALALAGEGNRVLLAEVEGRQGIAQLFDVPPLPFVERKVALGLGGGEVLGLAVDAKAALWEYLQLFYKLGRAGHLLERFGVVDFATTVAPGMRDVLMTGKVYEAVRRRGESREHHRRSSSKSTPPRRTTRSSWTRRRPAGSPDSSTSTPRWPGWPGSGRSAPRPTRSPGCCTRR